MVSFAWRLLPSRIKVELFINSHFRIWFHKKYSVKKTEFFPEVGNRITTRKKWRIFKIHWEAFKLMLRLDIFVYTNKCFFVLLLKSFQVFQLSGCCPAGQVNVQKWPKPISGWGWAKSLGMTGWLDRKWPRQKMTRQWCVSRGTHKIRSWCSEAQNNQDVFQTTNHFRYLFSLLFLGKSNKITQQHRN